ncbi:NO-inducible flavohemoprotein [Methylophaga thiooxydans]|uniref:Flavohemoprotein n=1 Tax=Methylophaga thiooxydans DMS010 TaxID=637616 RepID=C0N9G3_9GAMM|nr:NO-inducible flavohemoprotein [Methylophaga thiooxydans]EEF78541.1 Oxidoreductase NAD-binding domain protein [Methylophaga thiooxydans DMS010]
MIKPNTINVIKATVPVLQQHGEALTTLFYERMFKNNPEVKPFFNQAHQHSGGQQRALAGAICAYAEHIDEPEKLADAVELIAQKHASLGIKKEHYPIVGENLLAAIKTLLGDAATDEIINAWAEAYSNLMEIFINREQAIYDHHQKSFGWQGFKDFKVVKRENSSNTISSLYLQAADDMPLTPHTSGQYITVKWPTADGVSTLRNYSLSNRPGSEHYRISVKRELASISTPSGVVSNAIHDTIEEGDIIAISPPCGEFTLQAFDKTSTNHIVFIAGGVGITPLLSMLHTVLDNKNAVDVTLIQAVVNGDSHAFEEEIRSLANEHYNFTWHSRYSDPNGNDRNNQRFDSEGFIDDALLQDLVTSTAHTQFYLCGPEPMLQQCYQLLRHNNVASSQIHYEFFGPAGSLEHETPQ